MFAAEARARHLQCLKLLSSLKRCIYFRQGYTYRRKEETHFYSITNLIKLELTR